MANPFVRRTPRGLTSHPSFQPAKSEPAFTVPKTRPTIVALAVAACMMPAYIMAEWKPNVELFADYNSTRSFGGAQVLIPLRQNANNMTFLALRGQYGERADYEVNLGVGHRWFNDAHSWIFGGYGYYDSRETESSNRYHQLSLGVEALSVIWDFRANYYSVFADDENVIGTAGNSFKGFSIFSNGIVEEALDGVDAEIGALIPYIPWETRFFAGGFYYDGENNPDSIDGYRLRLETRPRKHIILGATYSDDNVNNGTAYFELKYAFGYARDAKHRTLDERMVQLPVRDVDIVVTSHVGNTRLISEAGLHIQKDHLDIDPGDLTMGDDDRGSYENPYETIDECNIHASGCLAVDTGGDAASDFIFVHGVLGGVDGNDRTTAATPYDGQFTLLDGQHLIGQGVGIRGIGGPANAPVVNYTGAGDTIVLANDNEVAGFELSSANGHAISGDDITGFDIHDNRIVGAPVAVTSGIVGLAAVGPGAGNGILISTHAIDGAVTLTEGTIHDNMFDGTDESAIYLLNHATDNGKSTQDVDILDNIILNAGEHGIRIQNNAKNAGDTDDVTTATQTATVLRNTITGSSEDGIKANNVADDNSNGDDTGMVTAMQTLDVDENVIDMSGDDGIDMHNFSFSSTGYASVDATQTSTLSGNTISNSGDDDDNNGIHLYNGSFNDSYSGMSSSTQMATLDNNEIFNSGDNGVYIVNSASSDDTDPGVTTVTQIVSFSFDNIHDNADDGLDIDQIDAENSGTDTLTASQTVTLNDTSVTDNGDDGLDIFAEDMAGAGLSVQVVDLSGGGNTIAIPVVAVPVPGVNAVVVDKEASVLVDQDVDLTGDNTITGPIVLPP